MGLYLYFLKKSRAKNDCKKVGKKVGQKNDCKKVGQI